MRLKNTYAKIISAQGNAARARAPKSVIAFHAVTFHRIPDLFVFYVLRPFRLFSPFFPKIRFYDSIIPKTDGKCKRLTGKLLSHFSL